MFQHVSTDERILVNLPEDGRHISRRIEATFTDDAQYLLHCDKIIVEIEYMIFSVEMWLETEEHPISNILEYREKNGQVIAQVVSTIVKTPDGEIELSANHISETGQTHIEVKANKTSDLDG